jgi:hypothetical protein
MQSSVIVFVFNVVLLGFHKINVVLVDFFVLGGQGTETTGGRSAGD